MSLILSIDPGKTTGVVSYDTLTGAPKCHASIHAIERSPEALWPLLEEAANSIAGIDTLTLVVEKFNRPRGYGHADLTPVEVIGVIKEFARQFGTQVVWQDRSQKKFFTDERLEEKSMWFKGKPHARDAARHLLYYLEFTLKKQKPTAVEGYVQPEILT